MVHNSGDARVLLLLIFVSSIDIGIPSIMCSRNLAIQLTMSKLYAVHIMHQTLIDESLRRY